MATFGPMVTSAPTLVHWRSLKYFSVYRLIVSVLVILSVRVQGWEVGSPEVPDGAALFSATAWIYLLLCAASLLAVANWPVRFNLHLGVQVFVDIAAFVVLLHAAGGLRSGVGVMLLVSLAGAGLVGQGRLVLSYAALATIALLGQQIIQALKSDFVGAQFVQAGAMSLAFFAVAVLARLLARRVLASEALARQRGEDLGKQLRLTNRVIALLDDGVLVVSAAGDVLQANPRARAFLGAEIGAEGDLVLPVVLAQAFHAWNADPESGQVEFRAGPQRTLLIARFIRVPEAGGDSLIFLQDVGEQREIAQRQKLAALGRLTGGIAHEIRNPLSAIRYAAELLKEDSRSPEDARKIEIVLDNIRRLDRIVHDVLELGRRDRARPQALDLSVILPTVISEMATSGGWPPECVAIDVRGFGDVSFDSSHLRQVLWNLVGNALRYSSKQPGCVRVRASPAPFEISVEDDGPGIPGPMLSQLFEPFFTTEPHGNGLGLYIARELCEANGCRIHYEAGSQGGARFVITGDASWHP